LGDSGGGEYAAAAFGPGWISGLRYRFDPVRRWLRLSELCVTRAGHGHGRVLVWNGIVAARDIAGRKALM